MADETYPDDRRYHEAHDWALLDGDVATFGITWHAQDALGDIVFVDLPAPGESLRAGQPYGEVESVKAVSDIVAPLDGEVLEVNDAVVATPEQLNEDPNGAWLVRVKLGDVAAADALMDAEAYRATLG